MKGLPMKIIDPNYLLTKKNNKKCETVKNKIIENIDENINKTLPMFFDKTLFKKDGLSDEELDKLSTLIHQRCFFFEDGDTETIYKLRYGTKCVLVLADNGTSLKDINSSLTELKKSVEKGSFDKQIKEFVEYNSIKKQPDDVEVKVEK